MEKNKYQKYNISAILKNMSPGEEVLLTSDDISIESLRPLISRVKRQTGLKFKLKVVEIGGGLSYHIKSLDSHES